LLRYLQNTAGGYFFAAPCIYLFSCSVFNVQHAVNL